MSFVSSEHAMTMAVAADPATPAPPATPGIALIVLGVITISLEIGDLFSFSAEIL